MGICNGHLSNPQCFICAFLVKPNTRLRLDFGVQSWTSIIPVGPFQLGIFSGSVILGLIKCTGCIIPKDLWLPVREHHALVCPRRPTCSPRPCDCRIHLPLNCP